MKGYNSYAHGINVQDFFPEDYSKFGRLNPMGLGGRNSLNPNAIGKAMNYMKKYEIDDDGNFTGNTYEMYKGASGEPVHDPSTRNQFAGNADGDIDDPYYAPTYNDELWNTPPENFAGNDGDDSALPDLGDYELAAHPGMNEPHAVEALDKIYNGVTYPSANERFLEEILANMDDETIRELLNEGQ